MDPKSYEELSAEDKKKAHFTLCKKYIQLFDKLRQVKGCREVTKELWTKYKDLEMANKTITKDRDFWKDKYYSMRKKTKKVIDLIKDEEREEEYDEEPPSGLCCPIGLNLMTDPVIARDTYTYEKDNIHKWFEMRPAYPFVSPMTNVNMKDGNLTPNRALRDVIDEWKEKHKKKLED
jgi:hypothetical protein